MSGCNHKVCKTSFCPHCGEPIKATPIQQLLSHCKVNCKSCLCRAERFREKMGYGVAEMRSEVRDFRVEGYLKSAARWQSYVDALEDLIKKTEVQE